MREPCPACKKLDGEINHPPGMNYVGWGLGWQPCLACKGTGLAEDVSGLVEIVRDLWVCVDCLMALANGDYPDEPEAAEAIVAGEQRVLPAHWSLDSATEDEGEGVDTRDFSRSTCDCCRSQLGGSRHRAALITG